MKRRNTFRAALALLLILTLCMPAAASGFTGKLIAITFDDGPGAYTAQLLDELAARDVKATFFVSGYRAANYPETLKRMVSEGHQLASHTQNHENLNTLSAAKIADEISRTQDYITAAGGDNPAYIRPPYGNANKTVRAQAPSPLINWSVDPEDWKYHNADTVCSNILAGSYDGAIILVHDIYQTSVNGALAAIDKLLEQGYEFVTVRDLLLRRGITPEAGVMYYDAKNTGVNLDIDEAGSGYYDESRLETHWAYDALTFCLNHGFLSREADGRVRPNKPITRGEFVTSLAKFCGVDESYRYYAETGYRDIASGSELAPYVKWARDAGLMDGSNGAFHPDDYLTREQMATVVARYLTALGRAPGGAAQTAYKDQSRISTWALDGVALCTREGILQGSNGAFLPKGKLTRAQAAAIVYRLSEME